MVSLNSARRSLAAMPLICIAASSLFALQVTAAPARKVYLMDEKSAREDRLYPIAQIGLIPDARGIAVSGTGHHILVVTEAGAVWAWGRNDYGQLGTGDTQRVDGWTRVDGLSGIVDVAAGGAHSLALDRDGTVWAWGANLEGQLGDGTLLSRTRPQRVPGLTNITSVAAGPECSVARRSDGSLLLFGANHGGLTVPGRESLLMRPLRILGVSTKGPIAIRDGQVRQREALTARTPVDWPGTMQLPRQLTAATSGFVLEENGWAAQRVNVDGGLVDLAVGWAVGWIEAVSGEEIDMAGSRVSQSEHPMGIAATGPDLSISLAAGVPFTVGDPAGYVLTITNGGDAATVGTITVTSALPNGLTYAGASGAGWSCQAPGQTVTCTTSSAVAAGGTSVIYMMLGVDQAAYPSLSATASVAAVGDANAANDSTTLVHAVHAKPARPPVGVYVLGAGHTLHLAPDGTVWSAGWNASGELGDGTTTNRPVLVKVAGLTGVIALAAGPQVSFALRNDGTVWSWGDNHYGQLGVASPSQRPLPAVVPGLSGVVAIAAQGYHTLALKNDGSVWAWGRNNLGQLGDGTTTDRAAPAQVTGVSGVVRIASGVEHSLAVTADGTVWTWGSGTLGQLGNGGNTDRSVPVKVVNLTGAVAVAGGYAHSYALTADGRVWFWGANGYAQNGGAIPSVPFTPAVIPTLTGVVAILAGQYDGMALLADGTVWQWGGPVYSSVPVQRSGVSGAVSIAAAGGPTVGSYFVVQSDGSAVAWGGNQFGGLATGAALYTPLPAQVAGLSGVVTLSVGGSTALVSKADGTVWGWGRNAVGQLGDGTQVTPRGFPVRVQNLAAPIALKPNGNYSLALLADGTVASWGGSSFGVLGDGTSGVRLVPAVIPGLTGIIRISASDDHVLALKSDGTVWSWGDNSYGQLGDGTNAGRFTPQQVPGLTGVVDVAAGLWFSVALKSDGTVWSWGGNFINQLGDGTHTDRLSPVSVVGLTGVTAISAGQGQGLALRNDHTVWIWGSNSGGTGDGSELQKRIPVKVNLLSGVVSISAGSMHCLALLDNGSVWAWGYNGSGELGDGTLTTRTVPVPVALLSGVVSISAGSGFSSAVRSDGSVWTWGSGLDGALGTGAPTVVNSPSPSMPAAHADLAIVMSSAGSVPVGGQVTYTLTMTNVGQAPTTGAITVTDTLPGGLTYASGNGTGWTCAASGQVVTCTNPGPLAAGGSSVVTLKATVLASAVPSVSNSAVVVNASDWNQGNNSTGDPLVLGVTTPLGVTPSSGLGSVQTFQVQYAGALGYGTLSWVQFLVAAATDGGGQPFCFLHYDVQGNAFWLYSDVDGFFHGPVAPGVPSNSLQGSQCALNTSASSAAGNGSTVTLNLSLYFKATGNHKVFLRAQDQSGVDTGWSERGRWDEYPIGVSNLIASPQTGTWSNPTFTLYYDDPFGFPGSAYGWEEFLIAAAPDGGGQPFCFLHYDRGGNAFWMYSSDMGFFLGPVAPGTASSALSSSACSLDTAGASVQDSSRSVTLTLPLTLKAPMSGAKKLYMRTLDVLTQDSGWLEKGVWTVP